MRETPEKIADNVIEFATSNVHHRISQFLAHKAVIKAIQKEREEREGLCRDAFMALRRNTVRVRTLDEHWQEWKQKNLESDQ